MVYGRGHSRILTEKDVNEILFGAESDLDDEEDNFDSLISPNPVIDDTIENKLLNEFEEAVNSQSNRNIVPEEINLVANDIENKISDELENVSILQPNLENTEVVFEVINESNVDEALAPKRMRITRNFVQRGNSPIFSTSSSIPSMNFSNF